MPYGFPHKKGEVAYLHCQQGTSDKFYIIANVGFTKGFAGEFAVFYGRMRTSGNSVRYVSQLEAIKLFNQKGKKGYVRKDPRTFMCDGGALAINHLDRLMAEHGMSLDDVDRGSYASSDSQPKPKEPSYPSALVEEPRDTSWAGDWF